MTEQTNVFITVKTYPTLSTKYDELVCTAGITDNGEWVRLYPIPFRKLDLEQKYVKYQWLSIPLARNNTDIRPETYRVVDAAAIKLGTKIGTYDDWNERRNIIFNKTIVYHNIDELIAKAKVNELSLAIFKPHKILDFVVAEVEREWSEKKLLLLESKSTQLSLLQTPEEVKREFSVVRKLPYKFSYKFIDDTGKDHTLMIEDWELGMLFWNCLENENGNEQNAIVKVRKKYFDDFLQKDIYFFLGTTKEHHLRARNPFIIIGVFYPPFQKQKTFFNV